jgi:hypothetical protein
MLGSSPTHNTFLPSLLIFSAKSITSQLLASVSACYLCRPLPCFKGLVLLCVLCRLHELDPALCAARLPRAVHALVPQLGAELDTARFAAMQVSGGVLFARGQSCNQSWQKLAAWLCFFKAQGTGQDGWQFEGLLHGEAVLHARKGVVCLLTASELLRWACPTLVSRLPVVPA